MNYCNIAGLLCKWKTCFSAKEIICFKIEKPNGFLLLFAASLRCNFYHALQQYMSYSRKNTAMFAYNHIIPKSNSGMTLLHSIRTQLKKITPGKHTTTATGILSVLGSFHDLVINCEHFLYIWEDFRGLTISFNLGIEETSFNKLKDAH